MNKWTKYGVYLIILVSAILLVVSMCNCNREYLIDDVGYGFSGLVYDNADNQPIEGAVIALNDTIASGYATIFTDSLGFFMGALFGTPTITIYCSKSGYLTRDTTVILDHDITDLDFGLIQN